MNIVLATDQLPSSLAIFNNSERLIAAFIDPSFSMLTPDGFTSGSTLFINDYASTTTKSTSLLSP